MDQALCWMNTYASSYLIIKQPHKIGIIIPILQMRKQRLRSYQNLSRVIYLKNGRPEYLQSQGFGLLFFKNFHGVK